MGNSQTQRQRATKIAISLTPLIILIVVVGLEFLPGRGFLVLDLAMASPLLAASLTGPRATAGYALVTVAVAALLGLHGNLYETDIGGGAGAQAARLAGITLGGLLAIAISRHRLAREAELRAVTHVAEVAQLAILGDLPSAIDHVRIAVSYTSAASEAKVGDDLYEVMDSPFGVRLIIGDTRGKGLDAVHLANRVLGCFRVDARRLDEIGDVVAYLDAEVATIGGPEDFVTAVVAQIGPDGRVVLVNAGHPDPILISATRVESVTAADRRPPLGLGVGCPADCLRMAPDDRLFFYTDGLAEARQLGTRAFFSVLPAVRASFANVSLQDGLTRLLSELDRWTRTSLDDDVALLAVQFDPRSETKGGSPPQPPGPSAPPRRRPPPAPRSGLPG
jgi:hypothetical protein